MKGILIDDRHMVMGIQKNQRSKESQAPKCYKDHRKSENISFIFA